MRTVLPRCLTSPRSTAGLAEWDESTTYLPAEHRCAVEPENHAGVCAKRTPLGVLLTQKKVEPFTWTWYSELIIRDEVRQLFQEFRLTGFEVERVRGRFKTQADERRRELEKEMRLFRKHGITHIEDEPIEDIWRREKAEIGNLDQRSPDDASIPPLWEVKVTGWGGMAAPGSGVKLVHQCSGCAYTEYSSCKDGSKLFDKSQWDGSDFFMIWPYPRVIWVSERLSALIKEHRLGPCRLVPIDEYDFAAASIVMPGRLRKHFSDERARAIGEPLGIY